MKKYFILGLSLMIVLNLQGQCPTGNITLNTQQQVDNFPVNYPGCTAMPYSINIQSNVINNLDGLSQLTSIGGDLYIQFNTLLSSIDGLSAITSVGGILYIYINPALTDLDAFSSITSVGGNIYVFANSSLTSIAGLENIGLTSNQVLVIGGNHNISVCELPNICSFLSDPSNIGDMFDNAPGCNSRPEVEAACALLPVELISFESEEQQGDCLLTWRTASEQENSHFEIEHSRNGVSFETIGIMEGNGTTTVGQVYNFIHHSPLSGVHYYRLKQYDFNGQYKYSSIISANILGDVFSIHPNPILDAEFRIDLGKLQDSKNLKLNIIDPNGKLVQQMILPQGDLAERVVSFKGLTSGMYIVELIEGEGFIYRQKLLKI